MPENRHPLALHFVNVGVETGQLLLVAALLAGKALLRRIASTVDSRGDVVAASCAIGGISALWLIEQVVAFGSG